MTQLDLSPAARRMTALISGLRDDQLDAPTPCPSYSVGELLAHVGGLALAFTAAAKKNTATWSSRLRATATFRRSPTTGGSASPPTWPHSPPRGTTPRRGPG